MQTFGQARFNRVNAHSAELQKSWWRGYSFPFSGADGSDPDEVARQYVEDHLRAAWSVGIKGEELHQTFAGNIKRLLKTAT